MQNRNYQRELEACMESENIGTKLLLHCCCAPCSSYVLEYLSERFDITVFFYNPNIYPEQEYDLRKRELKRLISETDYKRPMDFLDCDCRHSDFVSACGALAFEPEGGGRCRLCFCQRLEAAAREAAKGGYGCFTTTLTISPLKNAELINAIGFEEAKKAGARWLPCDFKKRGGFKRSIELSREHGLYRQNYCGCEFSRRTHEE